MNILGAFLQWFDETHVWKWFARNVMAHLTFRIFGYTEFDFDRWPELANVLMEASADRAHVYAFVSADKASLASVVIRFVSKSQWSHAGWLMKDEHGNHIAVHMKGKGLIVQQLFNVLRESDDFAVVRIPVRSSSAVLGKINHYAKNPSTVRYDFEQELEDAASPLEVEDIYCSELVWVCAKDEANLKTSTVLGRQAFSPDDVARSGTIAWSNISSK